MTATTTPTNGRNGNGTELAARSHRIEESPAKELMQLPPWLQSLRDAMGSSIQGDDLKEIMKAQVDKAKGGDERAAEFVFKQAHRMMQAEQKRLTIVQNNYYDTPADERPEAPIEPGDGREKEVRKLSRRAAAREPLTGRPGDRHVRPVTDEEEKELRRREAEAENEE